MSYIESNDNNENTKENSLQLRIGLRSMDITSLKQPMQRQVYMPPVCTIRDKLLVSVSYQSWMLPTRLMITPTKMGSACRISY